ncbi:hypothetical protein K474DRAFT_1712460 [Panus rudis PR-1116 ss-1]|nr:hypothetical protein K474DRAFT_1712460 [Panus rudis PR-1116 ss-1]
MSGRYNLRRGPASRSVVNDENAIPGAFEQAAPVANAPAAQAIPLTPIENTPGRRSYSQVVTSRSPSPDIIPEESTGASAGVEPSSVSSLTSVEELSAAAVAADTVPTPSVSAMARPDDVDENPNKWTTVRRGRRSLNTDEPVRAPSALSDGHIEAIRNAEDGLTPAQRLRFQNRMARVSTVSPERPPSRGEGMSKSQGKTIDPRNWGNSGIPPEDLDPAVQQRLLDAYDVRHSLRREFAPDELSEEEQRLALEHWAALKAARVASPHHEDSLTPPLVPPTPPPSVVEPPVILDPVPTTRETSVEVMAEQIAMLQREIAELRSVRSTTGSAGAVVAPAHAGPSKKSKWKAKKVKKTKSSSHIKPIAQIQPGSYIGRVLNTLDNTFPDDEPSDSSSSSSSSSNSDFDSDNDEPPRKKITVKQPVLVLKPEKPLPYTGSQDPRAFHKFVRQCVDYVGTKGYDIEPTMQVSVVPNFLGGKANDFFITCVSNNPRSWTLRRFFEELFNWCFPVDFRLQIQEKLLACQQ